jgi:uncharacterized protein (TIGR02145 family)
MKDEKETKQTSKSSFRRTIIASQNWEQQWMRDNLSVATFKNGDPIPEISSQVEWLEYCDNRLPACCVYDNDSTNIEKHGRLYNWFAVNDPRGLAPEGWHIPSNSEWLELENFLSQYDYDIDRDLKSLEGWPDGENGTDDTLFTALPSGKRDVLGNFEGQGNEVWFWSASESDGSHSSLISKDDFAIYRGFSEHNAYTYGNANKKMGLSVRCIKG